MSNESKQVIEEDKYILETLSQRDSHLSQAQLNHQQVITAETPEDTDLCQGHLSQQQWITSSREQQGLKLWHMQ